MKKNRVNPGRMVALFLLGCVLFNYPIFSLFNRNNFLSGIPVLLIFIFVSWGGVILLIALSVRNSNPPDEKTTDSNSFSHSR